ncbi:MULTISPECIES: CvpA family protein [Geomicrobium]|uniref:Membrane protein required for colicin V production n=1 Tax=Geomicrobium sediminis TaxID=1347788 RepID=A0ABS2P8P3_9BACL|nr:MULTISPECIES: CvpA family protein [Geomicrobium]MBM7631775.1 putative membrane protein required for colicin V production [Geomicrobium sediminis]GAK09729.1 possible colicin V production protein [Geomicrobium sp. JCM 19038]
MLSLLLLLLLITNFFIGLRRGFILQLFHLVSFFGSLIVAYLFYQDIAEYLRLWLPYPQFLDNPDNMLISAFNFEAVYYNGISFALLFFATRILLHILASMLDFVSHLPILRSINRLLGAVLGFIEAYLLIFVLLIVAALLPVDAIQEAIANSSIARLMIEQTPFLSDWLKTLWISPIEQS